jgi:hypothetical protein
MANSYPAACSFAGLYVPGKRPERNRQSIPTVYGNNGRRQIHQFSFFKVFAGEAVHFVRDLAYVCLGNRFGPGQRRSRAR